MWFLRDLNALYATSTWQTAVNMLVQSIATAAVFYMVEGEINIITVWIILLVVLTQMLIAQLIKYSRRDETH